MPKTKAQKRRRARTQTVKQDTVERTANRNVLVARTQAGSTQALVMAAMVALGGWGIAFTFVFLTNTQNHVLYGALAAAIALIWSFSFSMRLRKVLQSR